LIDMIGYYHERGRDGDHQRQASMTRIRIPRHPGALSPEWLTDVLRRTDVLTGEDRVHHVTLSDPGQEASYAGYVSRLTLEYECRDTPGPRTLIAKLPAPERIIRRLFRSLYRNEALFYRHLADRVPFPVPECYAALLNRKRTRSLLLLQDLQPFATPGDHDEGCTVEQARIALTRLAALHAQWWNSPELAEIDWLGQYRFNSRQNWMIYAGALGPFLYRLRHITPPQTLRMIRSLWRCRDTLLQRESGRPFSLQHGDFRLANLAFSADEVYAFDWQVVRTGPPLFDVAWFVVTSLTVEQRRAAEADLLHAYYAELCASGITSYTEDELIADYQLALVMTIPQMMVIGAFLRIDERREAELQKLLQRFDAARSDHNLEQVIRTTEASN
jgi:thiamine kinase-like enzyme